ncbi:MAG: DEAD/DEAH box helicase family protein [Deltaproteobacteria bacterium]|jgi:superfamily II DNA or RNA helicase|nr:DEAD/DEAH box helicase family protein [Deltaproteobacteria bacterium]
MELRPYQKDALRAVMAALKERPFALLQAPTGSGKCLGPGTSVLMYDGHVRKVEDVAVGDLLMGPDSLPREVVSLGTGTERMYTIVPIKGEPFTVNESHILSLRITGVERYHAVTAPDGRKYLAGDIVNLPVSDYLMGSKCFRHMAKGYRSGRIEFPVQDIELPIPPYILGVWLGDGNSRSPEICNVDFEVIDAWYGYAEAIGHDCRCHWQENRADIFRIKAPLGGDGRARGNMLLNALHDLDLILNKHVPHIYKTASAEERLELLAGVIDTDGYHYHDCYDLCLKQERFAKDVAFLARSLGLAAYVKPTLKTCTNTGATGEYWRISISGDLDIVPCKVKRRQASERRQKKNVLNFGFRVEDAGIGRYYGFELAGPDRRVLLGDFTVTHNTVIFAELIRNLLSSYPGMRFGVVAHRQELIVQARDRLLSAWPEGEKSVGMACAAAGPVETGRPVTVGSVQTLDRRDLPWAFDLLVADEAHRIGPVEAGGQYHSLIARNLAGNPALRVLGVTATPFRLGHGYIYGDACREGRTNVFPSLDYSITLDRLISEGWLSPWRGKKPVDMGLSLASVRTVRGDYDQRALSEEMSRPLHVESAVDAYARYGEGRTRALVFAVSLDHAARLAEAFRGAGHSAAAVHYALASRERAGTLRDFAEGRLRFLVNVGILAEGWDCPAVDLIIMCRPTKSAGLYVQMFGRGTRLSPGKKDLLVLDLAGNFDAHGDPSKPRVTWGRAGAGIPPLKCCPQCHEIVPLGARACPECGHEFDSGGPRVHGPASPEMTDFGPRRDGPREVDGWYMEPYVSRNGNRMARVEVRFADGDRVWHYLDFEARGSPRGRLAARQWWWGHASGAGREPPGKVDEALRRAGKDLVLEETLTVIEDGAGYRKVKEWSRFPGKNTIR